MEVSHFVTFFAAFFLSVDCLSMPNHNYYARGRAYSPVHQRRSVFPAPNPSGDFLSNIFDQINTMVSSSEQQSMESGHGNETRIERSRVWHFNTAGENGHGVRPENESTRTSYSQRGPSSRNEFSPRRQPSSRRGYRHKEIPERNQFKDTIYEYKRTYSWPKPEIRDLSRESHDNNYFPPITTRKPRQWRRVREEDRHPKKTSTPSPEDYDAELPQFMPTPLTVAQKMPDEEKSLPLVSLLPPLTYPEYPDTPPEVGVPDFGVPSEDVIKFDEYMPPEAAAPIPENEQLANNPDSYLNDFKYSNIIDQWFERNEYSKVPQPNDEIPKETFNSKNSEPAPRDFGKEEVERAEQPPQNKYLLPLQVLPSEMAGEARYHVVPTSEPNGVYFIPQPFAFYPPVPNRSMMQYSSVGIPEMIMAPNFRHFKSSKKAKDISIERHEMKPLAQTTPTATPIEDDFDISSPRERMMRSPQNSLKPLDYEYYDDYQGGYRRPPQPERLEARPDYRSQQMKYLEAVGEPAVYHLSAPQNDAIPMAPQVKKKKSNQPAPVNIANMKYQRTRTWQRPSEENKFSNPKPSILHSRYRGAYGRGANRRPMAIHDVRLTN